jgi:hypothetical protein
MAPNDFNAPSRLRFWLAGRGTRRAVTVSRRGEGEAMLGFFAWEGDTVVAASRAAAASPIGRWKTGWVGQVGCTGKRPARPWLGQKARWTELLPKN